ncbi:MAG: hypothetical protein N2444_00130 [Methylocystis sp.]|nr:hypothetical protein [Methylocystis sp.]
MIIPSVLFCADLLEALQSALNAKLFRKLDEKFAVLFVGNPIWNLEPAPFGDPPFHGFGRGGALPLPKLRVSVQPFHALAVLFPKLRVGVQPFHGFGRGGADFGHIRTHPARPASGWGDAGVRVLAVAAGHCAASSALHGRAALRTSPAKSTISRSNNRWRTEMDSGDAALDILDLLLAKLASKGMLDETDITTSVGRSMSFAAETGAADMARRLDQIEGRAYASLRPRGCGGSRDDSEG